MSIKTWKDKILARLFTRFPVLLKIWAKIRRSVTNLDTPWAPLAKELRDCKIALITTAGVHLRSQPPYNMEDKDGDPSFREMAARTSVDELMITDNYYDHRDAGRDINVVFPIERLKEFESLGIIGKVASIHFSFMGHILGHHIETLLNQTAPEVARRLMAEGVDAVFLTPA